MNFDHFVNLTNILKIDLNFSLGLENEGVFDTWQLLSALREKNITLGVRYLKGDFEGVTSYNQGRDQPTYGAVPIEEADANSLTMNKIDGVVVRKFFSKLF
jgi:hypothetical protein